MKKTDLELGMNRAISRRDFFHDAGLLALAGAVPGISFAESLALPHPEREAGYYPPTLTGLRGSHVGSFETAHRLARAGEKYPAGTDTGESTYDLVVVGGGISGLAAAWFYRQQHGSDAKILILDNHDDFGGHAKRNEFHENGATRLAWGGAINLEYPGYSKDVMGLLTALGVKIDELSNETDFGFHGLAGMQEAIYFDAEHYGRDVVAKGISPNSQPAAIADRVDEFPLSKPARDALKKFLRSGDDLLAPMSYDERLDYLNKTTYWDFLTQRVGLPREAAHVFLQSAQGYWALLADAIGTDVCLAMGLPGSNVIGEASEVFLADDPDGGKFAVFPDGNASVARLLVRSLIPAIAPGSTMQDVIEAPFDYARLDDDRSSVRLRLQSTAVQVRNFDGGVIVDYVQDGKVYQVKGGKSVLACYNMIIPYICPELPGEQKEALRYLVKHPLMASNVLLENGHAIEKTGVSRAYCPDRLHAECWAMGGIKLGSYAPEWDADMPLVMQFYGSIGDPFKGLSAREQNRAGRARMEQLTFADYERELRMTLAGIYGSAGLDPARDISAITVNRWPHGYAYEYLGPFDPKWAPGEAPHEIGRRPVGRIAIANSDSGVSAYLDSAIDQAWRAINELKNS